MPSALPVQPPLPLARLARYGLERVPRYTSYPTAPHFTKEVGVPAYEAWLARLPDDVPVSLYLHVPFCERMCWYCGCNTSVTHRYGPVADYVELLLAEIGLVRERIGRRIPAGAIHFGGGTPNILSGADFERIVAALREAFAIEPAAEIAAECDPRTLTKAWIDAAVVAGLNRVSLGVQDVNPVVQHRINRHQPWATTVWAVETLRGAGVGGVNLDLMYGLPLQTIDGIAQTVDAALSLLPDRIALFGYAHVPWAKPHQKVIRDSELPDATARLAQQDFAACRIEAHGYVRIGLDHFARPSDPMAQAFAAGAVRRNFQGYTTDSCRSLIGLGVSSIGRFEEGYVQNAARLPDWREAIEAGRLAAARGRQLTGDDRFRAEIIERLMCDLAVDLAEVAARHDRTVAGILPALVKICAMEADGLVERRDGRLTVTPAGRPFVRSVCAAFDAYLEPEEQRHALAV